MESFTPIASTIGGVLIGLAAVLLLVFNGRIAGISGVTGGILVPKAGDFGWRAFFTVGLLAAGVGAYAVVPELFAVDIDRSYLAVAVAGLFVGFGTRLGSGCTSGHGVCGLARFSPRSLVAVAAFMLTGAITAFVVRTLFGGAV